MFLLVGLLMAAFPFGHAEAIELLERLGGALPAADAAELAEVYGDWPEPLSIEGHTTAPYPLTSGQSYTQMSRDYFDVVRGLSDQLDHPTRVAYRDGLEHQGEPAYGVAWHRAFNPGDHLAEVDPFISHDQYWETEDTLLHELSHLAETPEQWANEDHGPAWQALFSDALEAALPPLAARHLQHRMGQH